VFKTTSSRLAIEKTANYSYHPFNEFNKIEKGCFKDDS